MKRLSELFEGQRDIIIESIEEDSRVRKSNYLFCCIKGMTVDGHQFASHAVANGAVAVLASEKVDVNVPVVMVEDTNKEMSRALSKFYDEPDKKLKLIGITGTDGKTTLSTIIYQLINRVDHCGLIGTNGVECKKFFREQLFTTPFPTDLYAFLNDFHQAGCNYVSMEATSERLHTNRLSELEFEVAIFTNLSRDHLNTHKTMENYLEAKSKLFKLVKKNGYSIINADDKNSEYIAKVANGKVMTYGIDNKADVMAKDIVVTPNWLTFTLVAPYGEYRIESPLSGKFNVYNLMAAITTCYALGFDVQTIINIVKELKPVKGRQILVECGQPFKVMVDYAHTAYALKYLLEYINLIKKGKTIIVIGSGGRRDKGRRIDLGEVVSELADYVIFTSEDPRTEDPNQIIDDMLTNVRDKKFKYERVIDRIKAIHRAIDLAKPGDVVLLTGKSDEPYMEIGTEVVHYPTDYKVAEEYLKKQVMKCR